MKQNPSDSSFTGPILEYGDFYFHVGTYSDPTRLTVGYDELAGFILDQVGLDHLEHEVYARNALCTENQIIISIHLVLDTFNSTPHFFISTADYTSINQSWANGQETLNAIQRYLMKFTGKGQKTRFFERRELQAGIVYLWAYQVR